MTTTVDATTTRAVTFDDAIVALWTEALQFAYTLARGERSAEITGDRRHRRFDGRGLHPYTEAWGRVLACESLLPGLSLLRDHGGDIPCEPATLRAQAQRDAEAAVEEEVRDGRTVWARSSGGAA